MFDDENAFVNRTCDHRVECTLHDKNFDCVGIGCEWIDFTPRPSGRDDDENGDDYDGDLDKGIRFRFIVCSVAPSDIASCISTFTAYWSYLKECAHVCEKCRKHGHFETRDPSNKWKRGRKPVTTGKEGKDNTAGKGDAKDYAPSDSSSVSYLILLRILLPPGAQKSWKTGGSCGKTHVCIEYCFR